ncbi:MAG: lipopolysaccharide biosynthesis protein, partial [Plesiomonas shigelloides]
MNKPFFIITIDTEGDNLWQNSQQITTKNTHY